MDLSIIIVNYNTKDLLLACLASIVKTTHVVRYEIIVVDNASHDNSLAVLRKEYPVVKIIANQDNVGFARANNQGIAQSSGAHVLLLNSDTIVCDGCLDAVYVYAMEHPQAGVIGCQVLNNDMSLQFSCYHHPSMLTEFIFFTKGIIKDFWDPVTSWKFMRSWDHKDARVVDSLSGCFFWVPRKVFDEVGFLDDTIFMYFEDAEFCRRLTLKSAYKVHYFPGAQIVHLGGASSDSGAMKIATFLRCFQASIYYLGLFYGKRRAGAFRGLCRFIWHFESFVFGLFRLNHKCRKKSEFLSEILRG